MDLDARIRRAKYEVLTIGKRLQDTKEEYEGAKRRLEKLEDEKLMEELLLADTNGKVKKFPMGPQPTLEDLVKKIPPERQLEILKNLTKGKEGE